MIGTTGSFAINGTRISLQPSTHKWSGRSELGVDGNNRPLYPAIREFEMSWDLMPVSDLAQLINAQLASVTGTLVMDLPQWGSSIYTFYSYSGTVAREPQVGQYFSEHVESVIWVVGNIRTN
jgi:hypothetical protein